MLTDILIRRLRIIPVRKGEASVPSKATVLAEFAGLGYRVRNPEDYSDSILAGYSETISTLKEMKGGNVAYVPLFTGFPEKAPDEDEYFAKRIVGFLANLLDLPISGPTVESGIEGYHQDGWLQCVRQLVIRYQGGCGRSLGELRSGTGQRARRLV